MNNSFSLTCLQRGGQIHFPKGWTRIKYCRAIAIETGVFVCHMKNYPLNHNKPKHLSMLNGNVGITDE